MSSLVPFNEGARPRELRRAGRSMERSKLRTELRIVSVDAETDTEMAKTDSVTAFTGAAMSQVARVAQAQVQLEQLAPQAAARLNMLADAHSMAVTDLMVDLTRKLRRI